jgi:hypothetical protein
MRAGRGIYIRPVESRFGTRPPVASKIVEAIAAQWGESVAPHGAAAANELGLTTQVPVREVYLTSGRSRRLKLGAQVVELRHVPAWQLVLPGSPAGAANVDNRSKLEVINHSAYTYDANDPGEIPSPPLTVLTTPVPVVSTYSVSSGGLFAPASATAMVTPTGNNSWKLSVVAAPYHDDNSYKAQIQSHASLGVNAINQAPFGLKSHIMIDAKMDTTPVCPKTPLVCSFPQGQILVVDANGKSTSAVLNSGSNPFPLVVDSSATAGNPVFITAGLENTPIAGGGTTTFRIDLTIQFLDN